MLVTIAGVIITVLTAIPVVLQLRTHPRGLFVLFFAEMWERFSYYGMRGLLIFYLTQHYLFADGRAQAQYGAYTSLVYLLPLIGGFLADRLLGTRKAILFGALLLVCGHLGMAFEGPPATQVLTYQGARYEFVAVGRGDEHHARIRVGQGLYDYGAAATGGLQIRGLPAGSPLPAMLPQGTFVLSVTQAPAIFQTVLYLSLSLIILGVGYLKANISSIVGQLYTENDPRRDPGFTLYYYGINLGAFWAAILCGWLGQSIGWWAGFGMAGIGMLAGAIAFVWGKPLLEGKGEPPDPERLRRPLIGPISTEWTIYLVSIASLGLVWLLVQNNAAVGWLLGAASAVVLGYIAYYAVTQASAVERDRLILAVILIAASVVFWTLFEQAGSSLNQFAERNTDLRIGIGAETMTASQTQTFNSGFILIFAPVFSAIWAWLGQRRIDPNPVVKFGLGLVQVGAGFFVLVWGASQFGGPTFHVPLMFLALAYLLHTTGELCLSPVGLSQMTKLSPLPLLSTIMATWFLASSWAQFIGAQVAGLTATETVAGQVLDPGRALATYAHVFNLIGWAGVAAGVILLALSPFLARLAHGSSNDDDDDYRPEVDGARQDYDPSEIRAER
jgi:POT family proton-dependent oligopeptide transporter